MENNTSLTKFQLSSVLQINNIDNKTRHNNEILLNNYKKYQNYSSLLLEIACNNQHQFSNEISLNAAIQLKNFISSSWKVEPPIVNVNEKNTLRMNLLDAIIFSIESEDFIILKQFNQCIKEILKRDFEEKFIKQYLDKVLNCLASKNLKQIYAGIILFFQFSKIFEFDEEKNENLYKDELTSLNKYLLLSLYECKDINNPIQAQFAYKILKIYFKIFQDIIPKLFSTEEILTKWMDYIINVIKEPINNENNQNIFWKLKRIAYQTIARIIRKFVKLNKDLNSKKTNFQLLLESKYISLFFELINTIYLSKNNKNYIDDYGKTCIYNFYSTLIEIPNFDNKVIKLFINNNNNLINEIIEDCFISNNDLELWVTDPKKYLYGKVEEIYSFPSKRYNACKLFTAIINYNNAFYYKELYDFLCKTLLKDEKNLKNELNLINKNNNNLSYYLKVESILYLIMNNCDLILKYSKKDFEIFIEKIIIPEFNSSCGFLREEACNFISHFKKYKFKNNQIIINITNILIQLMQTEQSLQIRFFAGIALSSILTQNNVKNIIKNNIKNLIEIYLKLIEETDLEEILISFQEIIKNFTEELRIYIVQLSDCLIKYFSKIISDDENDKDVFSLINNITSTYCNFIHYFINDNEIYSKIEKDINILLDYYLIKEANEKLEDGITILNQILQTGKNIPNHIWKYFIPLIQAIIGNENDIKKNNNKILIRKSFESFFDITNLICLFISKSPDIFYNLIDQNAIKYMDYVFKLIDKTFIICNEKNSFTDMRYIFNIIYTLFKSYKDKIDILLEQILKYISNNFQINNINEELSINLCILLSICFSYSSFKCIKFFNEGNKLKDIFNFWFSNIDKINKLTDLKYAIIGLCVLLNPKLQEKLIFDNYKLIIEKIFSLILKINKKIVRMQISTQKEENIKSKNDFSADEEEDNMSDDDELFKKFLNGEDITEDDEEDSWEEEDDDKNEKLLINIDKDNPILFCKNIFNDISLNYDDFFKNIISILGENAKILENIFNKEEQRLNKNENKKEL